MNEQDNKKVTKAGKIKKKFLEKPLWYKIFMISAIVIIVILLGLVGYAYRLMNLVNYDDGSNDTVSPTDYIETVENPEDYTNLPVATLEEIEVNDEHGRSIQGIYNILLLGLDKDSGNLSDAIIVVTIDTKNKALKLTSFMRDMLVQIPGYSNNKLNTAYGKGGISLIYDVFAANFDLKLDGYVAVNFSTLAEVIDTLGGVSVYMTKEEAHYLNTTNYIADVSSRNLEEFTGTHWLNGSQAVGYARVRHVSKGSEADDFARTTRQRQILDGIYAQFRNQSLADLLVMIEKVAPLVTTDLTPMEMTKIATNAVGAGILSVDIEQFRIPIANSYTDSWYNKMLVIDVDFKANNRELHKFIFGSVPDEFKDEDETEKSSADYEDEKEKETTRSSTTKTTSAANKTDSNAETTKKK